MRGTTAITMTILGAALLAGCAVPGMAAERVESVAIGDVEALEVGSAIDVAVTVGKEPGLELQGTRSALRRTEARTRGDTLVLTQRWSLWSWGAGRVEAELTVPDLSVVRASGASDVSVVGALTSDDVVEVTASGSSDVVAQAHAPTANVRASGSSRVALDGEVEVLRGSASGSSDLELAELLADRAEVVASGSSDARVHVRDDLRARASGSSQVSYTGDPEVQGTTSGASDVRRVGAAP